MSAIIPKVIDLKIPPMSDPTPKENGIAIPILTNISKKLLNIKKL